MDHFRSTTIKILKQHIFQKYGLDKEFEFMDKIRNQLQQTLNTDNETIKNLMDRVLDTNTIKPELNINFSDQE